MLSQTNTVVLDAFHKYYLISILHPRIAVYDNATFMLFHEQASMGGGGGDGLIYLSSKQDQMRDCPVTARSNYQTRYTTEIDHHFRP